MIGIDFNNRKEANKVILIMIAILGLSAITLLLMYNSMIEAIDTSYVRTIDTINYTFKHTVDLVKPSAIAFASILASIFLLAIRYANGKWKYIHISGSIITVITITLFITNITYTFLTFPILLLNTNLSFFSLLAYISRL